MANQNEFLNLDQKCFEYGIKILDSIEKNKSKDFENLIQKSLGVLQEDGVFAFYAFLKSKKDKEKEISNKILKESINLLKNEINLDVEDSYSKFKSLGEDLNNLFLAKTLIEKTLIYAKYHAQSMSDKNV